MRWCGSSSGWPLEHEGDESKESVSQTVFLSNRLAGAQDANIGEENQAICCTYDHFCVSRGFISGGCANSVANEAFPEVCFTDGPERTSADDVIERMTVKETLPWTYGGPQEAGYFFCNRQCLHHKTDTYQTHSEPSVSNSEQNQGMHDLGVEITRDLPNMVGHMQPTLNLPYPYAEVAVDDLWEAPSLLQDCHTLAMLQNHTTELVLHYLQFNVKRVSEESSDTEFAHRPKRVMIEGPSGQVAEHSPSLETHVNLDSDTSMGSSCEVSPIPTICGHGFHGQLSKMSSVSDCFHVLEKREPAL